MRYAQNPLRPGLTAIAAVLALSSTPLVAQTADPAPAAPVIVTPPPVVTPAPAVTAAAAAPASISNAPAPVSVELGPDPAATAEPAPTVQAAPRATPRVATAAPRVAAPATPAAAPEPQPAPVAPAPVVAQTAPVPSPIAAPEPAPVAATAPMTQTDPTADILPIAGAAGAVALLLAGGAFAVGRRRREKDAVTYAPETVSTPAEPNVAPMTAAQTMPLAAAPATYAAPPVSPRRHEVSGDAPVTAIPSGFDLSRFARHTQAAYRGPTPENPSLSLRRRLKRANFFDQRERMAAQGELPNTGYAPSAAATAPAARHAEYVTTKAPKSPRPTFRPAYSN